MKPELFAILASARARESRKALLIFPKNPEFLCGDRFDTHCVHHQYYRVFPRLEWRLFRGPQLVGRLSFFEALVIHPGRSFVRIMRPRTAPWNRRAADMTYGVSYLAALITMVVIDLAWLGVMAPRFYRPILGDIGLENVNISPAIAFYLIYPIGVVIFAVSPALKDGSVGTALLYGALFGFFTYATYDLTNHATLRNWTAQLTLVDVAWGTVLVSVTSAVAFWASSRFSGG